MKKILFTILISTSFHIQSETIKKTSTDFILDSEVEYNIDHMMKEAILTIGHLNDEKMQAQIDEDLNILFDEGKDCENENL